MLNYLLAFLSSMLPVWECRGSLILAATVWDIPWYFALPICAVGNLLPIPFILLFVPKILDFLERFKLFKPLVGWLRRLAEKRSGKILAGAFWGLFLFVALPCPGTGAWTGSLVASLFELPKKRSFLIVALGVLACGVIMTLAAYGVVGFLSFLIG